jgi:hypothetical protein
MAPTLSERVAGVTTTEATGIVVTKTVAVSASEPSDFLAMTL